MSLKEKLEFLLNEKGINTREFSVRSGIPYSTIRNIFDRGSEDVRASTLVKMARFFSISVDELLENEEETKKELIDMISFTKEGNLLLRGEPVSPELKKTLIKALDVFVD